MCEKCAETPIALTQRWRRANEERNQAAADICSIGSGPRLGPRSFDASVLGVTPVIEVKVSPSPSGSPLGGILPLRNADVEKRRTAGQISLKRVNVPAGPDCPHRD